MRTSKILIVGIVVLFFVFSCNKEKCNCSESDLTGKWEAQQFMSIESVAYPKKNEYNPVLEFKEDETIVLKLDVNSCSASYSVTENNLMECSVAGCTKICCDSPFSQKLTEMLPRVKSYVLEGNQLELHVPEWGWIDLQRISE